MPQFMAAAKVFWAAFTATAIGKAIAYVAINLILAAATRALMGRPRGAAAQPVEVTSAWSGTEPAVMVFGERWLPGREVFKGTAGENNRDLYVAYELARHQCEAIGDIMLDDVVIPSASIDGTTGQVTGGPFTAKVHIWKHLGRSDQTVNSALDAAFAAWTTNHRGRGVCYIVIKYIYDQKVFPSGAPQQVRAKVKGQRLYDPRKDSTNGGSGSHRVSQPTTWEWSNNPTLCRLSFVLGGSFCYDVDNTALMGHLGIGVSPSMIDWDTVIAAANVDDEDITGGSAPPSGAQKRYACDGQLSTGALLSDNLDLLDTCCAGITFCVGGVWNFYSGDYEAPTQTLTESDLSGDITLNPMSPHSDRFNLVNGTFYDMNVQQMTEFRPRQDASYVTRDGGRVLPRQIDLTMTTDPYRAQRIAEVHLNLGNQQATMTWPGSVSCNRVRLWENVNVTVAELGFSAKSFRVIGKTLREDLGVDLDLIESSAGSYADPATADYIDASGGTADGSVPDVLAPPTNFRASGVPSGIVFQWDLPDPYQVGTVFELYEYTASTSFGDATKIATTTSNNFTLPRSDTTQRYYWIIARRNAFVSTNVPSTDGLPAKAASVAAGLSASVSVGTISHVYSGSATATSESTTVTATGGTPGYTYAWTRVSGSTDISADFASAATTTFSVVSMADGATKSAIFRCTVTDSTAATYTIDVSVGFERDDVGDLVVAPSVSQTTVKISPTNSFASFKIGADGKWYKGATSGAAVVQGSWVQPNGNANLYSVRVTRTGGSETVFNSGTAGSWLACTTDQNFNITENTDGVASRNIIFTIELALTADTATILSTSTGNQLTASVDA